MDRSIDIPDYIPTGPKACAASRIRDSISIQSLFNDLSESTRELQRYPYDPFAWYKRAQCLESLGYPEMVAGDTWKATHLCQRLLLGSVLARDYFRPGFRTGFFMRDDNAEWTEDHRALFKAKISQLKQRALILHQQNTSAGSSETGRYIPQLYPWLLEHHRSRDDCVLRHINVALARASSHGETGEVSCVAARGALNVPDMHDAIGIFAKRSLKKDELLLRETSHCLGAKPTEADLMLVDSVDDDTACLLSHARQDNQGQEMQLLQELARSTSGHTPRTLLKARCLLKILDDGVQHPLDHPIMAGIKPSYHQQKATEFHLLDDVVLQNKALTMAGIDIFADMRFDTWVLFTMEARLDNNCISTPTTATLFPLFALFNHSCAPNARWQSEGDHVARVYAERDIEEGEQLFIAYNAYITDAPVAERSSALSRWIEGGCRCFRCEDERRGEGVGQLHGGQAHETAIGSEVAAWDCFEKPVFPEDKMDLPHRVGW